MGLCILIYLVCCWYIFEQAKCMVLILKEKLPQAFMQIGWMEDEFQKSNRKKFGQIWTNRNQEIWFFKGLINFDVCRPLRWHSSNICDVTDSTTVSNGTAQIFTKFLTFHENVSSLFFYN